LTLAFESSHAHSAALNSAHSRIGDVDIAEQSVDLVAQRIMDEVRIAVMAQTKKMNETLSRLITHP